MAHEELPAEIVQTRRCRATTVRRQKLTLEQEKVDGSGDSNGLCKNLQPAPDANRMPLPFGRVDVDLFAGAGGLPCRNY